MKRAALLLVILTLTAWLGASAKPPKPEVKPRVMMTIDADKSAIYPLWSKMTATADALARAVQSLLLGDATTEAHGERLETLEGKVDALESEVGQ